MTSPFLRWAGGKRQLLEQILPRIPEHNAYFEPFLGSGALFFALQPALAFLTDSNTELIETYSAIKTDVEALIEMLSTFEFGANEYAEVRSWKPKDLTLFQRAARFIYLNRTCFNGLYRVNKSGQFNVPIGKFGKKGPTICNPERLRECSKALKHVRLASCDFEATLEAPTDGDFVYIDPPYVPLTATSNFTAYTVDGFTHGDQVRLRDYALRLKNDGVHVMLSNSDTPVVRSLYADFTITEVKANRSINSKGSARGAITELLIQ